jgi:hypothetical protein
VAEFVAPDQAAMVSFWRWLYASPVQLRREYQDVVLSASIQDNRALEEYWQIIAHVGTMRKVNFELYATIAPLINGAAGGDETDAEAINIVLSELGRKSPTISALGRLYKVAREVEASMLDARYCSVQWLTAHLASLGESVAYEVVADFSVPLARKNGAPLAEYLDVNRYGFINPSTAKALATMGIKGPQPTLLRACKAMLHGVNGMQLPDLLRALSSWSRSEIAAGRWQANADPV